MFFNFSWTYRVMYFNCVTNCLWFWRFLHLVLYSSTQYALCSKYFCSTALVFWNSDRYTIGLFKKNIDRRMIKRFHVCFHSLLLTKHPIVARFVFKLSSIENMVFCACESVHVRPFLITEIQTYAFRPCVGLKKP